MPAFKSIHYSSAVIPLVKCLSSKCRRGICILQLCQSIPFHDTICDSQNTMGGLLRSLDDFDSLPVSISDMGTSSVHTCCTTERPIFICPEVEGSSLGNLVRIGLLISQVVVSAGESEGAFLAPTECVRLLNVATIVIEYSFASKIAGMTK